MAYIQMAYVQVAVRIVAGVVDNWLVFLSGTQKAAIWASVVPMGLAASLFWRRWVSCRSELSLDAGTAS